MEDESNVPRIVSVVVATWTALTPIVVTIYNFLKGLLTRISNNKIRIKVSNCDYQIITSELLKNGLTPKALDKGGHKIVFVKSRRVPNRTDVLLSFVHRVIEETRNRDSL